MTGRIHAEQIAQELRDLAVRNPAINGQLTMLADRLEETTENVAHVAEMDLEESVDELNAERSRASSLPEWVQIREHDAILPIDRLLEDPKLVSVIFAALVIAAFGCAIGILSTAIAELEKSRSTIN